MLQKETHKYQLCLILIRPNKTSDEQEVKRLAPINTCNVNICSPEERINGIDPKQCPQRHCEGSSTDILLITSDVLQQRLFPRVCVVTLCQHEGHLMIQAVGC